MSQQSSWNHLTCSSHFGTRWDQVVFDTRSYLTSEGHSLLSWNNYMTDRKWTDLLGYVLVNRNYKPLVVSTQGCKLQVFLLNINLSAIFLINCLVCWKWKPFLRAQGDPISQTPQDVQSYKTEKSSKSSHVTSWNQRIFGNFADFRFTDLPIALVAQIKITLTIWNQHYYH